VLESFRDRGHAVLPGLLEREEIDALKAAVDRTLATQAHGYTDPVIAALTWHPRVCEAVDALMGGRYVFHHVHAHRHDEGTEGVSWHQDYEQYPQTNRSHLMVHVFFYLNGLDGTVGDLLLLPGSEKSVLDRLALFHLGTPDLPGSVTIDDVPPGTAIIVHSAVLHARRAKPGGADRPRYFIDTSYCQSGIRWPSYPVFEDGFGGDAMLAELRDRHVDAGGTRPWLYDEAQFFDSTAARTLMEQFEGSVILDLRRWQS
jgi:hypothetical protein